MSIILVSKSIIRFILFDFCNIFGVENRKKLHKNEYFRGKFYENCTKMTILEACQIRIMILDSMELKYLLDSKLDSNNTGFEPYP